MQDVHAAGHEISAEGLFPFLRTLPAFEALVPTDKAHLQKLWLECRRRVESGCLSPDHPLRERYLDRDDLLRLGIDSASSAGVPAAERERIARLHYEIKEDLAKVKMAPLALLPPCAFEEGSIDAFADKALSHFGRHLSAINMKKKRKIRDDLRQRAAEWLAENGPAPDAGNRLFRALLEGCRECLGLTKADMIAGFVAARKVAAISLIPGRTLRFSYLVSDESVIEEGIRGIVVPKAPIRAAVSWWEKRNLPLRRDEKRQVVDELAAMDAVGRYLRKTGWKKFLHISDIAERLFPEAGPEHVARLCSFFAILSGPSETGDDAIVPQRNFSELIRERRLRLGFSPSFAARLLGVSAVHLARMEVGAGLGRGTPVVTERKTAALFLQSPGYGLPPEVVKKSHWHGHWREDPVVRKLDARTFHEEVFIDSRTYGRIQSYARFDFQTPGEVLYAPEVRPFFPRVRGQNGPRNRREPPRL